MRHARLFVSSLVVLLLFQFRFEAFSPRAGRQVGRIQPSVHRAVYLFHGNASRLFARRLVVFLTNAGTEQMTELRHVEVTVHATPATNFVVVQAEFFPVTGFRSPGARLDKKYFTSPVNTFRATIRQCRRVGKPASSLRQKTAHLTSHTSGPFSVSLIRYPCHDCSRKTGE